MTLNSSGPISLAGTTAGVSIEIELSGNGTTQISLNDTNVRTLAGVASGAITMPTNFYGKSSTTYYIGIMATLLGSNPGSNSYNPTTGLAIDSTYLYIASFYANCGSGQLAINKFNATTGSYISTFGYGASATGTAHWNACAASGNIRICGTYLYLVGQYNICFNSYTAVTFTVCGSALTPKFKASISTPATGRTCQGQVITAFQKMPNGNYVGTGSSGWAQCLGCCGSAGYNYAVIFVLNSAGNTVSWAAYGAYDTGSGFYTNITNVGTDSSSNIYASTFGMNTNSVGMTKFTSSGSVSWSKYYTGINTQVAGLSTTGSYIYRTHAYGSVHSINPSNGNNVFYATFNDGRYGPGGCDQDSSGNVYVTWAYQGGSPSTQGFAIIAKFNSSGTLQWVNKLTPTGSSLGGNGNGISAGNYGPFIKVTSNFIYISFSTIFFPSSYSYSNHPLGYAALPLDGSHNSGSTITVTAGSTSYYFTYASAGITPSFYSITANNTVGWTSTSGSVGGLSTQGFNNGTVSTGISTI